MKYVVQMPDGSVAIRNSHRTYTHAIARRQGAVWSVTSFCGSAVLADKEVAMQRRLDAKPGRYGGIADEYLVLPALECP